MRELEREVMNVRQAAAYLGISPDTLYKYLGEGKIPAFKLGGNRWRLKKSLLDDWMDVRCCSPVEPSLQAFVNNSPRGNA